MRFEADRQAFGAAGEAAELIEGALVCRNLWREAVVLVANVIVEGLRAFFVDQLRQLLKAHRFAELGLAAGVVDQSLGFLAGRVFRQVFALDKVAEGFEQGAGLAGAVDAFLAADEVAEIFRDLLAILALDERNVLFGLLVVLPLGNVDPRCQMQLAKVEMARRRHVELVGHRHAFAVVQQGDRQIVSHALLIVGEQHVAAHRQVGFFHQLLQMLDRHFTERGEVTAAVHVLLQPAAERERAGFRMEQAPGFALFGVVAFVEVGEHVFDGGGLGQFRVTGVQNCGRAVGFFVDQVDDAMTDRHGLLGCWKGGGQAPPKKRSVYRNHWFWRGLQGKTGARARP